MDALGRIINGERHSIWREFQRFGERSRIADQIKMELASSAETVGNVQLTRNWLVAARASSLDVTQLKDIMWIYKKIGSERGGKCISALVYDRYGCMTTIKEKHRRLE